MKALILNSGSSSLKCALFDLKTNPQHFIAPTWEATLQWKGHFENPILTTQSVQKKIIAPSPEKALKEMIYSIPAFDSIDVIGHRIVHGGRFYRESVPIDHAVKNKIGRLAEYAELHNKAALRYIEEMEQLLKDKPQIAVFDTAFHQTLPPEAIVYPGPYKWFEEGIQRYGFHGISYQYCTRRVIEMMGHKKSKTVICHLGAGASLCAVRDGCSIDTTMGLTPLEGLMMNTRCGSIDPGIVLEKLKNISLETLINELYHESGLLGISGISSDMRDILKNKQSHKRSHLAFEMYIHRLSSCIGSMITSLQGLDALVFTAGIGENTPILRQRICDGLAFLGIAIDPIQNEKRHNEDCELSLPTSKVRVYLIHTQEAFEIARECWKMLS